jgi:hypothetical protein
MTDDIELKDLAKAATLDGVAIASAVAAAPPSAKAAFVSKAVQPALRRLEARILKHEDKRELLKAVAVCFAMEVPVPSWLSEAFLDAYHSVPRSWDDVFGRPTPRRKSSNAERRYKKIRFKLYNNVEERHARGQPKDNELFAAVGKDFGISRATAARCYEKFLKEFKGKNLQHPYLQHIVGMLAPAQTAPLCAPSKSSKRMKGRRRIAGRS